MKELADCIRAIGEDLIRFADAFLLFAKPLATVVAVAEAKAAAEEKKAAKAEATEQKKGTQITRSDLRCLLAELSADGYADEVSSLLEKFGGSLSKVPEESYAELYKEASAIGGDENA